MIGPACQAVAARSGAPSQCCAIQCEISQRGGHLCAPGHDQLQCSRPATGPAAQSQVLVFRAPDQTPVCLTRCARSDGGWFAAQSQMPAFPRWDRYRPCTRARSSTSPCAGSGRGRLAVLSKAAGLPAHSIRCWPTRLIGQLQWSVVE